ncbi:uncharacterized protein LOC118465656 [Anopheles albimanus]|uniref:Uncharacterized protein n=1 Tax=Anopheles albimanus TaxID=7167 RepID=A0A182FCN0_ANOAL|nr:uncharacterized protein LOC118465656 [Anopheles albimanus]
MSTRSRQAVVLLVLVALFGVQHSKAAILTRAIEAQKTLVEREEQLLAQAKDQLYQTAQNALDTSRDAVMSAAEQMRYTLLSPWRMASEALERPKLYAKYLLSRSFAKPEGESAPPSVVDLNDSEATMTLPQMISNLPVVRLFVNDAAPTDDGMAQSKPSSLIEFSDFNAPAPGSLPSPSTEPEKITPMKVILL